VNPENVTWSPALNALEEYKVRVPAESEAYAMTVEFVEFAVQLRNLASHCPAQTWPLGEMVTRGSDVVYSIVGCGEIGLGSLFWVDRSTEAEIEAQSPALSVNCVGFSTME
jgi:hypothetical protein